MNPLAVSDVQHLPPPGVSPVPPREFRRQAARVKPCPKCGKKRWQLRAWTENCLLSPFVLHHAWIDCRACGFGQGVVLRSPGPVFPSLDHAVDRVFEAWNALDRPLVTHEVPE